MNEQQIQSLIDLGKTLAAVIFGYLLAVFKEWLNRNRLRYSMIKQLWHEIANFELKPFAYTGSSGRQIRRYPDSKPALSGHLVDWLDCTV